MINSQILIIEIIQKINLNNKIKHYVEYMRINYYSNSTYKTKNKTIYFKK